MRNKIKRLDHGQRVISTPENMANSISLQEWYDNGQPELWVLCDELDAKPGGLFRLFTSAGNSRLALTLQDEHGHDICQDVNNDSFPVHSNGLDGADVVGLGVYFGGSAKLYSR